MSAVLAEQIGRAPIVPLSEVADLVRGVSYPKADARVEPSPGFVPVLRATNIQDAKLVLDSDLVFIAERNVSPDQLLRQGDIVVATSSGSKHLVGKSGQLHASWQGSFGAFCAAIRPRSGIHSRYLALFLQAPAYWRQITQKAFGVNINNLRRGDLESLELPLPSLSVQASIVAEVERQFSRLDEAVADLKRVKANLKRQSAAILSAAISGQLFGRVSLPANPERPEFAPAIALPSGWSWVSAAEVCEVVAGGSTPKPEEMTGGAGEVPFIKVYNLGFDGSLDFTVKPTFVRRATHEGPLARSRCLPGDVLMNIVGPPLGKVSLVPDSFPEWNINQAIVTFRVGPRILNHLLAYWLMAPPLQRRIERTSKATAGQFNVQVSTCRKLVLPLPPLGEQARIVAEVDHRLSIVREVEAEVDANLKRAQALPQAVLARAFAGANEAVPSSI